MSKLKALLALITTSAQLCFLQALVFHQGLPKPLHVQLVLSLDPHTTHGYWAHLRQYEKRTTFLEDLSLTETCSGGLQMIPTRSCSKPQSFSIMLMMDTGEVPTCEYLYYLYKPQRCSQYRQPDDAWGLDSAD